jgi:probable F420-dependent oxidoreductase
MDLGFALPVSGAWATPANVTDIARAADQLGYRGLWTFQRVLVGADQQMPPVYLSVLDPIVTLGYAAAVTTRVRLGIAVVNGPFYAPAVLAKQLGAIDVLSQGRLDAGIGLGWSEDEYAAVGVPMSGRGHRFDEWLDCMQVLLTADPASFSGEYYQVPAAHFAPQPVQRPRPPLLIGGSAPAALRRAARFDGWISSSRASLDEVRSAVAGVREAAERAGRARDTVRCVVRGVAALRDETITAADRRPLYGTIEQMRADLERYAECGVDEVFLDLNFDPAVGNPDVASQVAMDKAWAVLDAFGGGVA